jgi:KDEL-tailed cysteine endopeptidase
MRQCVFMTLIGTTIACIFEDFQNWKDQHGILYKDEKQHDERFSIWKANDIKILTHNEFDDHTYTLSHNQFSDLTTEEFEYLHLGGYVHKPGLLNMFRGRVYWPSSDNVVLDAIDWRESGIVGAIRNQGQCGSCWAHAAIETVESIRAQLIGEVVPCSVQQLVSCDERDAGCNGGLPDNAYTYIMQHGIENEETYPYTSGTHGVDGTCNDNKERPKEIKVGVVTGFKDIPKKEEGIMRQVLNKHPISVAVDATKWQFYESGVFDHEDCGQSLNHAVQVVGYAQDGKYYIVRNSWGPEWGEGGYIKIVMDKNMCGISEAANFPIVSVTIDDVDRSYIS